MSSLCLPLIAALAVSAAPTTKIAVLPLTPGEGINEKTANAVTDLAASEVRRIPGIQIVTKQEITTLIGFERERAIVGCQEDSCMAEIGGALGVDRLLFGSIAQLGESWLVTMKVMDVKKARTLAQADRRLRKATIDDVLDAVPGMVAEIFGSPELARPAVHAGEATVIQTGATAPGSAPAALPPAWAEEPYDFGGQRPELQVATDDKGRFFAYLPYQSGTELLFVGDGKSFFAQRIGGAGAQGESFDYTIWEPRAPARWQASFEVKDGKASFHCGTEPRPLRILSAKEAKKQLAKATFFKPRWRRQLHALARDEDGTYYFVDRAREPEESKDFRLYVGTKGKMRPQPLEDVIRDDAGQVFRSAQGRFKVHYKDGRVEAEWAQGALKTPLSWLEVESNAAFAYGELGVYAGERLGTPCDGIF